MAEGDQGKKLTGEEAAIRWPDAQYREWVQSRIAGRVLLQFSGITVLSAILALGGAYTYINAFRADIEDDIAQEAGELAAEAVRGQIETEVISAMLSQSDLVDAAVREAQRQLIANIDELVETEDFIRPASEAVLNQIDESGGAQRIILNEAYDRLFHGEGTGDAATRALSLRLYVLFHPSVSSRQEGIAPIQSTFVDLLAGETDGISPELLSAVLENYPVGRGRSGHPECDAPDNDCDGWDLTVLEFVLDYFETNRLVAAVDSALQSFVSQLTPELADHTISWARANVANENSERILATLVRAQRPETIEQTVMRLSELVAEDDQAMTSRSLSVLAEIQPDVELSRDVRRHALERIWSHFEASDLDDMFSIEGLRQQVDLGPQMLGAGDTDDLEASRQSARVRDLAMSAAETRLSALDPDDFLFDLDPRSVAEIALLQNARRAILALLRPGTMDAPVVGQAEWVYVVRPAIGQTLSEAAQTAIAMRLSRDASMRRDVSGVADALLRELDARTNSVDEVILSVLLRHCSDVSFDELASSYAGGLWAANGRNSATTAASEALLARMMVDEARGYLWLSEQLAAAEDTDYESHLLSTFAMSPGDEPDGPAGSPLLRALREMAQNDERNTEGHHGIFHATLLDRLIALNERDRWQAARIVEDSGIMRGNLATRAELSESLATLAAQFDWIGTPLPDDTQSITIRSDRATLDIPLHRFDAGHWLRLGVEQTRSYYFDLPGDAQLVAFDTDRETPLARLDTAGSVVLREGVYALHLRGRTEFASGLVVERRRAFQPNSRAAAYMLDDGRYELATGQESGEFWIQFELSAGETIEIETMAATGAVSPVDTVLELFGSSRRDFIARDDDGGSDVYSRLVYMPEMSGTYFLRVHKFFNAEFDPRTSFDIMVSSAE